MKKLLLFIMLTVFQFGALASSKWVITVNNKSKNEYELRSNGC